MWSRQQEEATPNTHRLAQAGEDHADVGDGRHLLGDLVAALVRHGGQLLGALRQPRHDEVLEQTALVLAARIAHSALQTKGEKWTN